MPAGCALPLLRHHRQLQPCYMRSPRPAPAMQNGTSKLLTANSGDARILLVRGGQAIQLTEDHVPGERAGCSYKTVAPPTRRGCAGAPPSAAGDLLMHALGSLCCSAARCG